MNDYIINPMWFYWVSVVNAFKTIALFATCFSGISAGIMVICAFVDAIDLSSDDYKGLRRAFCILLVILCISTLLCVFIPSKTIMYQMMIAKYTTYSNAQSLLDAIKNGADYIVESMKALR